MLATLLDIVHVGNICTKKEDRRSTRGEYPRVDLSDTCAVRMACRPLEQLLEPPADEELLRQAADLERPCQP